MPCAIPLLALLATIATAAPSDIPIKDAGVLDPSAGSGDTQNRQTNLWKTAGVLDPWDQYGIKREERSLAHLTEEQRINSTGVISRTDLDLENLQALAKRFELSTYRSYLPGCSKEDDPSFAPQKPDWDINYGVIIPPDGNDGECLDKTKHSMCWTDYLLAEAAVEYTSWVPVGGAINCDASNPDNSCSSAQGDLRQTCSTIGSTETNGYDIKVIDAALKLSYGGKDGGFGAGLDLGAGYTIHKDKTNVNLKQVCATDQKVDTCTWAPDMKGDNNCHQVWQADRVLHVWGQAQRMCKGCTKASVQQNTEIEMPYGKVCVRGQKEFDFVIPINKLQHCNGKCGEANPGLGIPPNGQRGSYQTPADWDALHLQTQTTEDS